MHKNLRQPISIFTLALITILFLSFNSSHPTGGGGKTGAPGDGTCLDCHMAVSSTIDGNMMITGLPALITEGTTYTISVTSEFTAGSPSKAGFQVVALLHSDDSNAGTWSNESSSTSIVTGGGRTYFGHAPSRSFSGTSITWTADWTAPTVSSDEDITFYGVTALVNGNGMNSGDKIKFTTTTVSIMSSAVPVTCTTTLINDILCNGSEDGSAIVNATGGDGNFTYEWSTGETSQTAIMLLSGLNTVTVTDGLGETNTCSIMIAESPPLITTINTTNALCFDSNLGTATASTTGGTPNYLYTWSNGGTGDTQTDLIPGNYSVTTLDDNNCEVTTNFSITGPTGPIVISLVSLNNASCAQVSNGNAEVLASGGLEPYTYFWPTNNTSGASIDNLAPGVYTVEVSDANSCLVLYDITIGTEYTMSFSIDDIMSAGCTGSSTGSATVSADNGTPTYTYGWSNGGTGTTQTGLAAGTYTVTATDINGCTSDGEVVISAIDNEPPTMSKDTFEIFLDDIGEATILKDSISQYAKDNCGVQSVNINIPIYNCTNLGDNSLDIMLEDVNGNTSTVSITIIVVDNISPTIVCPTNVSSNQCGVIIYDIPVANDNCSTNNVELITGLASGQVFPVGVTIVTYKVSDQSGNTDSCTFTVTIVADLAIVSTSTNVSCNGNNDGTATLTITGGKEPYSTSYPTGVDPQNLAAGQYIATVTDDGGCTAQETITITEPEILVTTTSITNVTCFNYNDGSVIFNIDGGTSPYTIAFMNDLDYNNLEAGTYTYMVKDTNNCEVSGSLEITEPDVLIISGHSITNASSSETSDGSITINIIGGEEPYTFEWSSNDTVVSTNMNLIDALPGIYTCKVIDVNGCIFNSTEWVIDFESSVINHDNRLNIEIYPNPSNGFINISLNKNIDQDINISIINSQGLIIKNIASQFDHKNNQIDLNTIPNGFYFIQLSNKEFNVTKKLYILR